MADNIPAHVHYAPMFRDMAGRAIVFPLMQCPANDAASAQAVGEHIAREPRMGLRLIGLASFPCQGETQAWEPDGTHPALGYYRVLAGGTPEVDIIIAGRC